MKVWIWAIVIAAAITAGYFGYQAMNKAKSEDKPKEDASPTK